MINPMKYKYLVAIMTADKKAYDITQFVEDVSWEEGEDQLAARISFSAKNDKTSKGRISSLAKPGCYAALLYSYNGGKNAEATRGKIVEWNPSARTSGEKFKVKAYDVLYDLQESQDHVYFSAGVKTKSAIVQVLKRWGIKVTSYSGPNVKHGKLAYKSEKLGTVVVKILKEAKKKGGIEACLRAVKMNVTVVGFGTNKTVYHFEETQHLTEVNHKISTTGMVTRVKIIGKANDDGCSPVEATVDGKTSYGIRQKIVSRGTNDTLDEAKKEAREILADDGKPKEEITIKLPDIPIIRKGDKIHLKTASISAGYYIVRGAHDYRKDACLTMRDFETVILRCILYYNSQRIIENFPYTEEMLQEEVKPFASSIFEWGKQKEGVNLIPVSKEELILTLLPRTTGKLTRFGLRVKGMRYHADGYTEKYLKGGEVTVAYNPEDVSHVWLFENGNYQIFDLIESRFRGKDMVEAEKLKADCNEMIKNASAGNLQAKIDLAMHIQNIASHAVHTEDTKIKNIRRTRQREQRKRHVDFVKEGIGNE